MDDTDISCLKKMSPSLKRPITVAMYAQFCASLPPKFDHEAFVGGPPSFPTENQEEVLSCIWKHPSAHPVYLACDVLGQEEILMEISKTFGSKIYVDKLSLAEYHSIVSIVAPDVLTEDPSCRFHVCEGFPRLYERAKAKFAEAKRNIQPEPLFVRPSAQWYICEERMDGAGSGLITSAAFRRRTQLAPKEAVRDQFGVWHVCYSMHSSQQELEEALAILSPKEVISTTPNCRATELRYVRGKNCNAGVCFEHDLDWHLKPSMKTLPRIGSTAGISQVPVIKSTMVHVAEKTSSPTKQEKQSLEFHVDLKGQNIDGNMQPSNPTKPIPLFGRARNCLPPSPPMSFSDGEDSSGSPECRASLCDDASPSPPLHSSEEMEAIPCRKNLSQSTKSLAAGELWAENGSSPGSRKDREEGMQLSMQRAFHMGEEFKNQSKLREQSNQADNSGSPSSRKDGEIQNRLAGCALEETCSDFDGRNSRILHESVRKMYRSLHVPIPQPLPSLLELASLIKRPKLRASQS